MHVGIRTRYANGRIKLAWLSRGVSRAYACACVRRLRAALRERHPRAVHRANYTYDANIAGYSVDLAALADVVGSRTLPCSNGVRSSVGASRESSCAACCFAGCCRAISILIGSLLGGNEWGCLTGRLAVGEGWSGRCLCLLSINVRHSVGPPMEGAELSIAAALTLSLVAVWPWRQRSTCALGRARAVGRCVF